MGKIAVTVDFRIRDEARADWEQLLHELAAGVATEKGNLCYAISRSDAEPGLYHVIELYDSPEAFEAHKTAPHSVACLPRMKVFLTAPPVIRVTNVVASAS